MEEDNNSENGHSDMEDEWISINYIYIILFYILNIFV